MSEQQTKEPPDAPEALTSITFHNIKSNYFRVIHVDGAIGSLTPQGNIQMAVYSERKANPQEQTFALGPDGALGQEITDSRVGKTGVVRELEAELILDLQTADNLRAWLEEWLTKARQIIEQQIATLQGEAGS